MESMTLNDSPTRRGRVVGDVVGLATRTRSARLARALPTTRAQIQPWRDAGVGRGTAEDQIDLR
jgi:hypothetical protein